jgi:hypothetical protein
MDDYRGRGIMTDNSGETPCFVALCECGGWKAVMVDVPEMAKDNAKEIGKLMRAGFSIEKRKVYQIRSGESPICKCPRKQDKQRKLL